MIFSSCNQGTDDAAKTNIDSSINTRIQHDAKDINSTQSNTQTDKNNGIIICMNKENGMYIVPCTVNGLKLNFIFDTGASDVSISEAEAIFMLKNNYLTTNDILGKQYYSDANGDISEGTKIILRKIEFNGMTLYDVEASVVYNMRAPLLLGQSAISKLGKIQIDPEKNTLTVFNKDAEIKADESRQGLEQLDIKNGFKNFLLGEGFYVFQNQVSLAKVQSDSAKNIFRYEYIGEVDIAGKKIDRLLLDYYKGKLMEIEILIFNKENYVTTFSDIKNSLFSIYGIPNTENGKKFAGMVYYEWDGMVVHLYAGYDSTNGFIEVSFTQKDIEKHMHMDNL